jgi:hypothetical protein
VRQKPKTPEQWATLTEAWFVACEYEPTVEDFRLLAEFLWENQDSVKVDADNLEFTFTSITERSPYFEKMSFYRYA